MKKTFLLICLAAGLLSCTKEMTPQEEAPAGVPMTFEISVAGTKAAKTDWENGDEVYVFLSGIDNKYLKLSYDIATQTWEVSECGGSFTSTDFETMFENTLTAVYNPRICDIVIEDDYFAILDEKMKPIFNYYLAQTRVPFTVDGTTVEASITLEKPENFVQFHIADIEDAVNNYTLASPQVRPVALKGVRPDGTLLTEIQQAGARLSGFADADGAIFAGRLVNPDADAYSFTLSYMDPSVTSNDKIYRLERNSALTAGKMYNFPTPSDSRWTATLASDLYVSLGAGNMWAKCNLGATTPTDPGAYYAWGELQPKTRYYEGNYLFDPLGNPKYYDGEAVLEKIDDAAFAALGGRFRMPTAWDFMGILDPSNCTWSWVTNYDGTGVNGWLVTSIVKGYIGNFIFLPAVGYILDETKEGDNSTGLYWASSKYESCGPESLSFSSEPLSKTLGHSYDRIYGLSIRPIYSWY